MTRKARRLLWREGNRQQLPPLQAALKGKERELEKVTVGDKKPRQQLPISRIQVSEVGIQEGGRVLGDCTLSKYPMAVDVLPRVLKIQYVNVAQKHDYTVPLVSMGGWF